MTWCGLPTLPSFVKSKWEIVGRGQDCAVGRMRVLRCLCCLWWWYWYRWVPALNSIRLLCREWLCSQPRLIYGFCSRKQTDQMLAGKPEGTFIVRFSTSHLGLLSISFVSPKSHSSHRETPRTGDADSSTPSQTNGASSTSKKTQTRHLLVQVEDDGRLVVFMEPGRLRHASLEDLVASSMSLTHFYPGVPKAKAFEQLAKYR